MLASILTLTPQKAGGGGEGAAGGGPIALVKELVEKVPDSVDFL